MNSMLAILLAAGAAGQAPDRVPAPPATAPAPINGPWSVVYAEWRGQPLNLGNTLDIRGGSFQLMLDGQPRTFHLDFGPGHSVQAVPAGQIVPATTVPASPAPARTPPVAGAPPHPGDPPPAPPPPPRAGDAPRTQPVPPGRGTSVTAPSTPREETTPIPTGRGTTPPLPGAVTAPGTEGVGSGAMTGRPGEAGRPPVPLPGAARTAAVVPGSMEGVFIVSNNFLCLSLNPVGVEAPAPSGRTTTSLRPNTGAGNAVIPPPQTQPGPVTAAPGQPVTTLRRDALVLILRQSAPPPAP